MIYTFIQGVNGNIIARKTVNTERPSDEKGVRIITTSPVLTFLFLYIYLQVLRVEYQYFIFVCSSNQRRITLGVLYGYKALLQILAVILALKTRKVQVKGLDDSKYIIAATYLSSLVLLAVIIMTYTAYELINTYAVVTSASFILGSTAIIAIVFIPKVSVSLFIYLCMNIKWIFALRWWYSIRIQKVPQCLSQLIHTSGVNQMMWMTIILPH